MKKCKMVFGMLAVAVAFGMMVTGCDDLTKDGSGASATQNFTVSYDAGAGSGTAPANQTVALGTTIYLPGQGTMTAPSSQIFNGWRTNSQSYASGASFVVTGTTVFVAQWTATGTGDSGPVNTTLLQAEPHPASSMEEPPKVIGSFNDGTSNHYLVDVGYISKMFISELGTFDYTGFVGQSFNISKTNSTTVTNSLTTTVSESVAVSLTVGEKVSIGTEAGADLWGVKVGVKTNLEASWSATASVTGSKSTSNTAQTATTYSEGLNLGYVFRADDPQGTYRYAMYGVCDVYFVLETSPDNQTLLGWDTVVCARPGYTHRFEYSADGRFTSEPTGTIDFKENFWKNLEIPNIPDIPVLSFDTGGGTEVIPRNVSVGTPLPLAGVVAPTRTDYVFAGWDTHGHTTMPNEPLTITAKWLALSQRIDFNVGNPRVNDWYRTDWRLISLELAALRDLGYKTVSFEWNTYWAENATNPDCTAHIALDCADINKDRENWTYYDQIVNPGAGWKWVTWNFSSPIVTVIDRPHIRCAYGYDKHETNSYYDLSGIVTLTITVVE
jgi:uncharacterized repeat protein (TIGR02543 family)